MTWMQWITLAMYLIVVAIWVAMVLGIVRARGTASKAAKKNLVFMSGILAALTVLQYLSHR